MQAAESEVRSPAAGGRQIASDKTVGHVRRATNRINRQYWFVVRDNNGEARAYITKKSRGGQQPKFFAKMRRDGSRRISPSCQNC